MKVLTTLVAAIVLILSSLATAAPDSKPDPREKLETAIPEAIRLLEAKDYKTFLKTFVAPEDFKKITDRTPPDEFAKQFAENKAAKLLEVLKSLKDAKPTLDASGNKASYEIKEDPKKPIKWAKIDKLWYIQN